MAIALPTITTPSHASLPPEPVLFTSRFSSSHIGLSITLLRYVSSKQAMELASTLRLRLMESVSGCCGLGWVREDGG